MSSLAIYASYREYAYGARGAMFAIYTATQFTVIL